VQILLHGGPHQPEGGSITAISELSNRPAHSRPASELEHSALALQLHIFEPPAIAQSNENADDLLNSR
jgi:hypothetical protein